MLNNQLIKKNKKLELQQKWSIIAYASRYRNPLNNKLSYGALNLLSERFDYGKKTIENVLKEYDEKIANGNIFINLTPSKRENCGPPSNFTEEVRDNLIDLHNMTKTTFAFSTVYRTELRNLKWLQKTKKF